MPVLKCEQCGKQFERDGAQLSYFEHHFCSRKCQHAWRRRDQSEIVCDACGKTLARCRSAVERAKHHFCSKECKHDWQRRARVHKTCPVCGKEFTLSPSQSDQRFCSMACYNKRKGAILTGRTFSEEAKENMRQAFQNRVSINDLLRSPRLFNQCEQCGRYFEVSRKYLQGQRFCSTECWYEYIREDPERHPAWKGGYEPYYGPNWLQQRDKARKRDNYTCQECGVTETELGQELDVHHIIRFHDFAPEDYKEANQLDNLVCLCKSCHASHRCD